MKKLLVIACLLLALLLAVTACTQDPPAEQPTDTSETVIGTPTEPEETQPENSKPEETQPEETKPEETKPRETEPQETEPQETEPQETEPQETEPQETEPQETEPDIIENTNIRFFTEVEKQAVGTAIDYTDLFNLFDMVLPQGSCGVEMFNGQKVYAMHLINCMHYANDGFYYFKVNNVQTVAGGDLRSYMLVRGYQRVNSDWLIQNKDNGATTIRQFYEHDGAGHTGGAGIYAAIVDGNLHLILKYYDNTADRRIGNKLYTIPCESTELTMADDGSTVYILVGDKLMATIALSGSITYEDIKAQNCSPRNTFAASATVKLANGTEETIENTLIADTPLSQIGISTRGGAFLFSYLEYGPFSKLSIPEMDVTTPHEHAWVEASCTTPKTCSLCHIIAGDKLGHDYVDGTCSRCGESFAELSTSFSASAADETDGTPFANSALKDYFTLDMKQAGCVVSKGQYHMTGINQIFKDMDGTYFITLKDASAAGSTDRAWLLVRGYNSVTTGKKTVTGYCEDDGNSQVGPSGIYARIEAGELYIMLKYADASCKSGIGIEIFTINCEGDDLTVADNGSTVYILVDGKTYATIRLKGTSNTGSASAGDGGFAAEAIITLADGTTKTFTDTLIANTCKAQIGIATRNCDFYFSSVEVGGFSAIEIPEIIAEE